MAIGEVYTVGYSLVGGSGLTTSDTLYTDDGEGTKIDPSFSVDSIEGNEFEGIATVTQLTEGTPSTSGSYLIDDDDDLYEQTTDFLPAGEAPTKAENSTPLDAASNISKNMATLTWEDGGGAESYDVFFGITSGDLTQIATGITDLSVSIANYNPLAYSTVYYWRVDSINEYGTTTGDEWSFLVLINPLTYARPSNYNPDLIWDEDAGEWIAADGSAGSRLQTNLVAIGSNNTGQGVIYYG